MKGDSKAMKRRTLHGHLEGAAVTLVLGGHLAAIAARVAVHHFHNSHFVHVDLERKKKPKKQASFKSARRTLSSWSRCQQTKQLMADVLMGLPLCSCRRSP